MSEHIIVDLETLDIRPTAKILSIGAVKINSDTLKIHSPFYSNIHQNSYKDSKKFTQSESTLKFWADQSPEAKAVLKVNQFELKDVLNAFSDYIGEGSYVWGNGASFDNAILEWTYSVYGIRQPWKYSHNMCYRTIKKMHPMFELPFEGIQHYALDDAIHQARHLVCICKEKGLILP
jgi:exodeoxyribonuclease VIII